MSAARELSPIKHMDFDINPDLLSECAKFQRRRMKVMKSIRSYFYLVAAGLNLIDRDLALRV